MARVEIPLQTLPRNGKIDELTWTAADAANDHYYDNSSGRVILLSRNDDNAAKAVTGVSIADPYGRTGDHSMSIDATGGGASQVGAFGQMDPVAWNQQGASELGQVHVDIANDTSLAFAALLIK